MNTLVLFYSRSGHTKAAARAVAEQRQAKLCEVTESRRSSLLGAFFRGAPASMRRRATPIDPLSVSLADFDKIILMAPVWANHPAPAFNSMVALLPAGREVEVHLISSSGQSGDVEGTKALIAARGCTVTDWCDIKA